MDVGNSIVKTVNSKKGYVIREMDIFEVINIPNCVWVKKKKTKKKNKYKWGKLLKKMKECIRKNPWPGFNHD